MTNPRTASVEELRHLVETAIWIIEEMGARAPSHPTGEPEKQLRMWAKDARAKLSR
jgi:hypothetical protein